MQVNLYEAKTQLSRLVEKALAGEEVVIARNGKPVVTLTPFVKQRKWVGIDEGKGKVHENFNDPLDDDFLAFFAGEKE